MAGNKKISQLTSYTALQDADLVPIVDTANATTKQTTWANIKSVMNTFIALTYATLTGIQTLTNKTLTSPAINTPTITSPIINMGSDADGDILIRSGGAYIRLPKGSNTNVLTLAAGLPAWSAPVVTSNASTTVAGIVEIATTAEITAGTGTGGTGALLVVPASAVGAVGASKLVQFNASSQYPAADGSLITGVVSYANGNTTKDASDASTTQNIPHGLSRAPSKVRIRAAFTVASSEINLNTETVYNGTTQSSISQRRTGGGFDSTDATFAINGSNSSDKNVGVVTFDATNIIITWTRTGSPSGIYQILWEAST